MPEWLILVAILVIWAVIMILSAWRLNLKSKTYPRQLEKENEMMLAMLV